MQSAPSADTAEGRPRPSSFRRLGVPAVALSLALGAAQLAAAAPSQAATAGPTTRVAVGKAPTLPKGSVAASAPSSSTKLSLDVELNTGKTAELEAYASGVADRNSPYYHDYLTPAQVAQTFGASTAQINAVEAQLGSEGLTGASVMDNGLFVHVSATVAQAEKAFGVSIKGYTAAGHGFFANSTAPTVSSSIAADVSGLVGLDSISYAVPEYVASGHTAQAPAVSQFKNDTVAPHASVGSCNSIVSAFNQGTDPAVDGTDYYTDDQLANIYGITGVPSRGAGVTVAVVEFEPYDPTGVTDLLDCYGGSHGGVSETMVDGGPSGTPNMFQNVGVESALDIENIGVLAPGSDIIDYAGPSGNSLTDAAWLDTFNAAISGPAQVISDSWGECEAVDDTPTENSENTLFASAAAMGKTVLAASGDNGSTDCYEQNTDSTAISVDDPASQPYVTGVGGTTMTGLSNPPQSVWNWTIKQGQTTYAGATGGGLSSMWGLPSYQADDKGPGYTTYCATAATTGCRQVPDVSALGDPNDGYVIEEYASNVLGSGETYGIIGGTSGAAPVWAAIVALADSSAQCTANGPAGFINPALYTAGNGMSRYSVFRDITKGNNYNSYEAGGTGHGYSAGSGYDMASGWGTPEAPGVISTVCQAPVVSPASYFTPVTPTRILNTRSDVGANGPVAGNGTVSFGLGGAVSGAVSAAVINLTVTGATGNGFATAYPDGSAVPSSSNVNWAKGQTLPNLVVVPVGSDGKIDIHNSSTGTAQFIGDLMGYFTTTSSASTSTYTAVGPIRAMDTRNGTGVPEGMIGQTTADQLKVGGATITSGGQSVTIPSGISAVAMNVTVTNTTKAGFLTVYPNENSAGSPVTVPGTSNLNFAAGQTIPNMVMVPVGADGKVDFIGGGGTGAKANVIADISGYFTPGTSGQVYHALGPDRILDSRIALGSSGTSPIAAQGTLGLPLPSTATAIITNLTVTNTANNGFVTAYPLNSTRPSSSNVNFAHGQTIANLAIIPSKSGVDFYNSSTGTTSLIADLAGYFSAS